MEEQREALRRLQEMERKAGVGAAYGRMGKERAFCDGVCWNCLELHASVLNVTSVDVLEVSMAQEGIPNVNWEQVRNLETWKCMCKVEYCS
jgi:hypothetical protein